MSSSREAWTRARFSIVQKEPLAGFRASASASLGLTPSISATGLLFRSADPDGNGWVLQEVTKRLAGRVAGDTTYASARDLAQAMIRAAKAHGQHEKRIGQADPNWPDWYAEYMVREQSGEELPL